MKISIVYGFFGKAYISLSVDPLFSELKFMFAETIKEEGKEIGFKDEKTAKDFMSKIENKIRKHFREFELRYLKARSLAAVNN